MSLHKVLTTLNQMESEGVFSRFAIGGAIGATFYLEPVATLDVDVFVTIHQMSQRALISLEPIYSFLLSHGAKAEGEYLVIADWPVQFLAPGNSLVEEALEKARTVEVEGIQTRVFTAEHLAAIALQTGRPKDKARLLQFLEAGVLNEEIFGEILVQHDLETAYAKFKQQFME